MAATAGGTSGRHAPEIVALGEPLVEFVAVERGPLAEVRTFRRGWGGDTANFLVAAARLGTVAGYITRVGGDEYGQACRAFWVAERIDVSHVVTDPDGFTGLYFVTLDADGRHAFTYYRAGSAASRLSPRDVDPDYLRAARILHTSGITHAISASASAAANAAITSAREHGILVSYDVNVRPKLRPLDALRPVIEWAVSRADVVFLSQEDALHLFGPSRPEEALARVLRLGPRLAVLKRGGAGCLVADGGGRPKPVPGWRVDAVDATGAGDAFDAAFLVKWLRGATPPEAAHFANAVGALTSRGRGATSTIPTAAEVAAFMGDSRGEK